MKRKKKYEKKKVQESKDEISKHSDTIGGLLYIRNGDIDELIIACSSGGYWLKP